MTKSTGRSICCQFSQFGLSADGMYKFTADSVPKNVKLLRKGQIGGKARGLLFVMNHLENGGILTQHQQILGFPDSLIITTTVFDEFMHINNLAETVLAGCNEEISQNELRNKFLAAKFPHNAQEQLGCFLEDEKRPLVVRSSSVMEDNPDHSFAGIYLSLFLSNNGTHSERLEELVMSIKSVYASTFGPNARAYRKRHHLVWQQEKMAILIQNMIGNHYQHDLFYPLVGGVGFSRNFYPWSDRLRQQDGVVRMVVGTGTRAVGREYARVFSPRLPGVFPEGRDTRTVVHNSQETVDALDMASGRFIHIPLRKLDNPLLSKVCSVVTEDGTLSEPVSNVLLGGRYIATFNRFIENKQILPFTEMVREILANLETLFDLPVDIEFAVVLPSDRRKAENSRFYLLQARPLGGRAEHRRIRLPMANDKDKILFCNNVLGNGRRLGIRDLVFVNPETYRLDKASAIARQVGRINQELETEGYILVGPGRWGTSNPQLGVPVQYGEIANASVIVEMATESFAPELSYGTHFYADMVARKVLYLPLREHDGDLLNRRLLDTLPTLYQDDYITHYHVEQGMDVYVDGEGKKGTAILSDRR